MGGGKDHGSHGAAAAGGHGHEHAHGDGHGHGHDHHHKPRVINSVINYHIPEADHPIAEFKAPDYKIYKVENAPNLVKIQNRLSRLGLKDSWLRNEVWRFDPQFGKPLPRQHLLKLASTGMGYGLILAVGTVVLQFAYSRVFGTQDAHGHGHGHDHGHGHGHEKGGH